MVLKICTYPDPVLKKKTSAVAAVDGDILRLLDDMVETMYASSGVGLAAPQIGKSLRAVVVDVSGVVEGAALLRLLNPEITESHGTAFAEEGCLSLPEFTTEIPRAEGVTVRAMDEQGRTLSIKADGFLARALQHEIDHLEGMLILDRAGFLSREFYKKRVRKRKLAEAR